MAFWRHLTRGLRGLTDKDAADRDVSDEVQHYFEQATDEYIARGLSPDAARRQARAELGAAASVSEEVRSYGWENLVTTVVADVRYGARRLRATPGFTAIAALTLAIGVGAATAIFSAVNPILFQPLPYPEPNRVVSVLELGRDGARSDGTFAMFRRFQERARSLEAIAVYRAWQPTVTGNDQPERLLGQRVTANYFHVLGVSPRIGHDFDPAEDRPHGADRVILSDALWRRRFNADPAIVGRPITLDDSPFTVVGVMPRTFDNVLAPEAGVWTLLQYDPALPLDGREWGHHLRTIGRLAPGVSAAVAAQDVNTIGRTLIAEQHPETYDPETRFGALPLQGELTRGVRPALLVILAAVTLVLVIACVNVTNLLLARGAQRRGEFALRAALGAGRARLVRQLLTESLLLALLGGAGGVAVAILGARALVALSPPGLPRANAIAVNGAMFGFALAVTTLVGLVIGLMPSLHAARSDPRGDLQHGSRQTVGHRRARSLLVIAEVALALVLLVSSGLLLRSMQRLFAVPAGFDAANLVTMQVQLVGHRFDRDPVAYQYFDQTLEAVRRVPGVAAAGFTTQLPLSGDRDEYGAHFDATPSQPAATFGVFRYAVSPGFLETMRIPLRSGRLLDERDHAGTTPVVLISESLAQARFQGQNPIGERLRIGGSAYCTIVGVVGNVRQLSLALTDSDAVYMPATQSWFGAAHTMSLVVRGRGDAATLAPAIRDAVWSIDKDQPVTRVATMGALLDASAGERRFALVLFEGFALAALVLAAAGIYGVLAGSVTERTREIGVRAALGASRARILALIVRDGMTLTGFGMAIGLAGALVATRAIAAMLFGISRLDPVTYAGVMAVLAGVSVLACAIPAWRAARVDPATTLRSE